MFKSILLILTCLALVGADRLLAADVHWQRINLDKTFRSEGVTAFDVNHDGKVDVIAGDVWYEAPDWKMHEIRTPGNYVFDKGYSRQLLQLLLRRERRRLGRSDLHRFSRCRFPLV